MLQKFILWLASMRMVQAFRLYFGEDWVQIRKNDRRFIESDKVRYEGDRSVPPTTYDTDRLDWHTLLVFKLAEQSHPAFIAVDDAFGNRWACLGKIVDPGEKIAIRVGFENAEALFIAPKITTRPPKIKLLLRCTEANLAMSDNPPKIL